MSIPLTLCLDQQKYGICRLLPSEPLPVWVPNSDFYSITKTMEELSIVCALEQIPTGILCERDWRSLKIEGTLDFSLIGILSSISTILAQSKISIFAISTYDTDYILVKDKDIEDAITALTKQGYRII